MSVHPLKIGLTFLGLALVLAGYGYRTPVDPTAREAIRELQPATVPEGYYAAAVTDALNRVIPELAGPGLPDLISAVRDLASALRTPEGEKIVPAAVNARAALIAFELAGNRRYAADLDVIRLAIASTGIPN